MKYAYIVDISEEQLSPLLHACENAKFHLNVGYAYPSAPILDMLAAQLDKIHLGGRPPNPRNAAQGDGTWNKCVNLRSVDIRRCNVRTMRETMRMPKTQLRILIAAMGKDGDRKDVKEIVDTAVDETGGVESFSYAGPKPAYQDAFEKFMRKNNISWNP